MIRCKIQFRARLDCEATLHHPLNHYFMQSDESELSSYDQRMISFALVESPDFFIFKKDCKCKKPLQNAVHWEPGTFRQARGSRASIGLNRQKASKIQKTTWFTPANKGQRKPQYHAQSQAAQFLWAHELWVDRTLFWQCCSIQYYTSPRLVFWEPYTYSTDLIRIYTAESKINCMGCNS